MNKLYELGSVVDILIKPNTDTVIGNKTYKANEPYTVLKDVSVGLIYEQISSDITAKKPINSSQKARPYQITINDIQLTQKILDLILTRIENTDYIRTIKEICIAEKNSIYLNNEPIKDLFIYDKSGSAVRVDNIEDNIVSGNFNDGESYLVFYESKIDNVIYSFEMPHYPYFTLEINGKGNTDKNTSSIYCKFPAVSLVSIPNINFINEDILNSPLIFNIIYQNQKEPIIVLG